MASDEQGRGGLTREQEERVREIVREEPARRAGGGSQADRAADAGQRDAQYIPLDEDDEGGAVEGGPANLPRRGR